MQPANWPSKLVYLPESVGVQVHILLLRLTMASSHLQERASSVPWLDEKKVHPHLEIRRLIPPHPLAFVKDAQGREQYGLFAKKPIAKDTFLGEFTGEITLFTSIKECRFNWIAPLNGNYWCIDSSRRSNELMYVNDYRGLSQAPNAACAQILHRGLYYFGYASLRKIDEDEEIFVWYGPDSETWNLPEDVFL